MKSLLGGAAGHTAKDEALHLASVNGHCEGAKLLLDNGANIRTEDDAPLRWAAKKGIMEGVTLLLNNDACLEVALKNTADSKKSADILREAYAPRETKLLKNPCRIGTYWSFLVQSVCERLVCKSRRWTLYFPPQIECFIATAWDRERK